MYKLFLNFWADDGAFIISTEMLFVSVILVIGLIAGLSALRAQLVAALTRLGDAIAMLDPGYYVQPLEHATGGSNGTIVTFTPTATVIIISRAVPSNNPTTLIAPADTAASPMTTIP